VFSDNKRYLLLLNVRFGDMTTLVDFGIALIQHGLVHDLVLYGKRLNSCEMFE